MALRAAAVLVSTASGAPGTAALVRALRENGERDVRLVGTDMSERSVGGSLCDAFHLVPPGSDRLRGRDAGGRRARAGRRRAAPVVLRPRRARRAPRGFPVPVLVSRPDTIHRSNDKAETYAFLTEIGVRAPEFRRVDGAAEVDGRARARLPGPPRLLQAGVLVRLARLSRPRSHGRSRPPAPPRAPRAGGDAPRGGRRAAPGRGRPELLVMELRPAASGRSTASPTAARRARPPEDPRGDARRPGDVLRDARRRGADGDRRPDRRRARDRVVLQHPARRRAGHRGEPADLDDRLPGGPEPPVPRRQASPGRDLGRRARELRGGSARAARALRYFDQLEWDRDPPAAVSNHGDRPLRVVHCPVNTAGSRGRTSRRSGGAGSTRGSSSSTATRCTPRPTARST